MNKKLIVLATFASSSIAIGVLKTNSLEKNNDLVTSYLVSDEQNIPTNKILEINEPTHESVNKEEPKVTFDYSWYGKWFFGYYHIHLNGAFVKEYIEKIDISGYSYDAINKHLAEKIKEKTVDWIDLYDSSLQAKEINKQISKIREAYKLNKGIDFKFQKGVLSETKIDE